ncbi:MAG: hypothetical protein KAI41_00515, partial [Hyphomicrobiaceae bacterium]|nr:hypothetical protein [Hyphomicrobiaceae bacterium]
QERSCSRSFPEASITVRKRTLTLGFDMPGDVFEQCSEDWARPLEREHDRDLVPGAKMVRWPAVGTSWRSIGSRP